MDIQQINSFIFINQNKFKTIHIPMVRNILELLDTHSLMRLNLKNPISILVVSIFLGSLGLDRFLLKNIKTGILKVAISLSSKILLFVIAAQYADDNTNTFLTSYLFSSLFMSGFLFWLCDIFTAISRTKTYNLLQLRDLAHQLGIMIPALETSYVQNSSAPQTAYISRTASDTPNRYNTSDRNNYQTEISNNYNTRTPDYSKYQRQSDKTDN